MARPQSTMTAGEYLAQERRAEFKSEFYGGELFAMAAASRADGLIVTNLIGALLPHVKRRGCELYPSDMRLGVPETELYTYPDIVVACGEPRFEDEVLDTLLNPTLIVEVLSPSTETYDRGQKFAHYRTLPSLTDYVLVAQDRLLVEHYVRQAGGTWLLTIADRTDAAVEIPALGCRLMLTEVYDGMGELPAATGHHP